MLDGGREGEGKGGALMGRGKDWVGRDHWMTSGFFSVSGWVLAELFLFLFEKLLLLLFVCVPFDVLCDLFIFIRKQRLW